jgi:hypothetical protein
MQKPIPAKMREEMNNDPFMHSCCVADETCEGRIEWNHHLRFAGKRVNEPWGILPMCSSHHRREAQFRDILDHIMVWRAEDHELLPYCKAKNYLKIKHGT